jgi:hypothetical protein
MMIENSKGTMRLMFAPVWSRRDPNKYQEMKEELSFCDESERNTTVESKKVHNRRGKMSLCYYGA